VTRPLHYWFICVYDVIDRRVPLTNLTISETKWGCIQIICKSITDITFVIDFIFFVFAH
jgi:hypothetical protein